MKLLEEIFFILSLSLSVYLHLTKHVNMIHDLFSELSNTKKKNMLDLQRCGTSREQVNKSNSTQYILASEGVCFSQRVCGGNVCCHFSTLERYMCSFLLSVYHPVLSLSRYITFFFTYHNLLFSLL